MPTTRQRLDTLLLLLLPHLPAKAQCLHKPTSTVVVVPVAEQKKKKRHKCTQPLQLVLSSAHKAHNPYHITHERKLDGRLGVNADEKPAAKPER